MRILYLSALASQGVIADVQEKYPKFNSHAVQKFSRLLVEGLVSNGAVVKVLSSFYLPSVGFYWYHKPDTEKGVLFNYIPTINVGALRHIWLIVYTFFYVLGWGLFGKKDKVLLCDVLNISLCIGAVAAARIIGLKRIGVVTDIPGMAPGRSIKEVLELKQTQLCMRYITKFSHYVLLTKQMNDIVNPYKKPYMIMEGLVDSDMELINAVAKDEKRIIMYAGGLKEGYGLRLLVEGFLEADIDNSELWIYGDGDFVDDLLKYEQKDKRVKYYGLCPNDVIVKAEMRATLLVNPRPTHEEITLFSFPSKNMEYIVSGTPLLTTILPGMPEEYYPYVYLFDQGETIEGYSKAIKNVLNLSDEVLKQKGDTAKRWVLANKNNLIQSKRIIDFLRMN